MILTFFTPEGTVVIDSDKVTDLELSEIKLDRANLDDVLALQPRDLTAEIDSLESRIEKLEVTDAERI